MSKRDNLCKSCHRNDAPPGCKGEFFMLHIVACIKQVPDTKIIKMNPKTNTMDRSSAPAILNPYDAHAVEEAVRLKKGTGEQFPS